MVTPTKTPSVTVGPRSNVCFHHIQKRIHSVQVLIRITFSLFSTDQGKSVTVQIKDECPTCDKRHLDLTRGAFNVLASEDVGLMDVTWSWV